jgi:hypothetical protein
MGAGMSATRDPRSARLEQDIANCLATAREFRLALPGANDERVQAHFQPVLELAIEALGKLAERLSPSVADDLASLRSLAGRFRIESDDPDFGRSRGLRELRGHQGNLIADIDQALESAAALGLAVTASGMDLPDNALLERAGREGQLAALNRRLAAIAEQLDTVIRPEAAGPEVSGQQQVLVSYYADAMKIEVDVARTEAATRERVDLVTLGRAIGRTADLTADFIATVKGAAARMTESLRKAAPAVGEVVQRAVTGFRAVVRSVWKTESREPSAPSPSIPDSPPDGFDEIEANRLFRAGTPPPKAWWPFIKRLDLGKGINFYAERDLEDLRETDPVFKDFRLLAGLHNLEKLWLHNRQIRSLAPLAGLASLQTLSLNNTQVSDFAPLAGLASLQTLSLNDTRVSDLAPLAGLASLQTLSLNNTQVRDLAPLEGLASLQMLWLDNTRVTDWSPVAHVENVHGRPEDWKKRGGR